jgi:hypothetical protein
MTKENVTMPTPEELANFCAKCADDKLAENIKVITADRAEFNGRNTKTRDERRYR